MIQEIKDKIAKKTASASLETINECQPLQPNEIVYFSERDAAFKILCSRMETYQVRNDQVEDNTCLLEDIDKLHNAKNSSFTRESFRVHNRESRIEMFIDYNTHLSSSAQVERFSVGGSIIQLFSKPPRSQLKTYLFIYKVCFKTVAEYLSAFSCNLQFYILANISFNTYK